MQWLRLYDDLLDDPKAQQLRPELFKELLFAVLRGTATEDNPFLDFVEGPFVDNGRPPLAEWRVIRQRIFERDDFTCRYCGERGGRLECDHVVPVSRGGSNDDENLVIVCFACNRAKRTKLVEEWMR